MSASQTNSNALLCSASAKSSSLVLDEISKYVDECRSQISPTPQPIDDHISSLLTAVTKVLQDAQYSISTNSSNVQISSSVIPVFLKKVLLFHHTIARNAFTLYKSGITTHLRPFLLPNHSNKSNKAIRNPFDMRRIEDKFNSYSTGDDIHAEAMNRFAARNTPRAFFRYMIDDSGRAVILNVLIHTFNVLTKLFIAGTDCSVTPSVPISDYLNSLFPIPPSGTKWFTKFDYEVPLSCVPFCRALWLNFVIFSIPWLRCRYNRESIGFVLFTLLMFPLLLILGKSQKITGS